MRLLPPDKPDMPAWVQASHSPVVVPMPEEPLKWWHPNGRWFYAQMAVGGVLWAHLPPMILAWRANTRDEAWAGITEWMAEPFQDLDHSPGGVPGRYRLRTTLIEGFRINE